MKIRRRTFLQVGTGVVLGSTIHSWVQKPQVSGGIAKAQATAKISIGYWPVAAALPLYLALEKGYFKQAGLDVEVIKFSEEQQAVAGLKTGQIQGVANGFGSDSLAGVPGLVKIIASNTIGGTLNSPWFGGSAALSTQFFQQNSVTAKQYIDAYRRAIASIRTNPEAARQYLEGYTEIKGEHTKAVPLPEYRLYDEFTTSEIEYFQKFFDLLPAQTRLPRKLEVTSLILKDLQVA